MSKEIKQKADELVGLFKPYSKIFVDCTSTEYDESIKCAILHQKRLIEGCSQHFWPVTPYLIEQKAILTELKSRL